VIAVLMGVTGAGKTTVGRRLAADLGWVFVEGDDLHPPANIDRMRRGEPLTDADRWPWLRALRGRIDELVLAGRSAVVTCSALKEAYRDALAAERPEVRFVYLQAPAGVIEDRLRHRVGHFMPPGLLASQLETLEEPTDAVAVDARSTPAEIVAAVRRGLGI
jgi:gluconokinase